MEIIDAELGLRSDRCFVATQRQSELAGESLKLQKLIAQTESELRAKDAPVKELRARMRSALEKLSEIQRHQR